MDSSLRIRKMEPKIETLDDDLPSSSHSIPKTLTLALIPPSFQTHPPPLRAILPNVPSERRHISRLLHSIPHSATAVTSPLKPNSRKRSICPRGSVLQRVTAISSSDLIRTRDLVRRTRILYESIRTRLQETQTPAPLYRRSRADLHPLYRRTRADLHAATVMKEANLWLNRENRTCGYIPGLEIGDIFFYRMELCVLGLHGQVQGGIDYLVASQNSNGESIATSVVVSGGYEDDQDFGDVIVYTGQGGREGKNETRHSVDQKLEGGNLALERSCHHGVEIRVFRGLDCDRSPTGRVYVYDGLYKVADWWTEMGKSGFMVYKFELVRLGEQGEMGSAVLKLANELKKNVPRNLRGGCLSRDISKGKERQPVALYNDIDNDSDPLRFTYLVRPTFHGSFAAREINGGEGCRCVYDCSANCTCVSRNGGELPFDLNGRLLRGKALVYECGRNCKCPSTCVNRVSQKGLNHRLEVFRSNETNWGVRSLDVICAGEFVCEISGIILTKEEAEAASRDGKSLFYPNRMPRRWKEWGDLSKVRMDCKRASRFPPPPPNVEYAINVSKVRNVGCYLSHSCNPNVFMQYVLFSHYNEEYPRLMVFASENIPPLRELSLDYGLGDLTEDQMFLTMGDGPG